MSDSDGASAGIVTTVQIVFLILKLAGLVAWSWFWVLSPLWISAALLIGACIVALIIWVVLGE